MGFFASFVRVKNLYSVKVERKLWTSIGEWRVFFLFPIYFTFVKSIVSFFPALYGSALTFFLLGITRTDNFEAVMGLLTATIVTNSFIYNGLFSNHADLSPNYVGILVGLSNTIGNISSLLAPLFVGLIVTDPVITSILIFV